MKKLAFIISFIAAGIAKAAAIGGFLLGGVPAIIVVASGVAVAVVGVYKGDRATADTGVILSAQAQTKEININDKINLAIASGQISENAGQSAMNEILSRSQEGNLDFNSLSAETQRTLINVLK